jgi:hypothetical protein
MPGSRAVALAENCDRALQRLLIGLGLVILAAGVLWPILSRIGLGRPPGDIMFQRDGATFYFPLVTCIIISIVLSALFSAVQSVMLGTRTDRRCERTSRLIGGERWHA